MAQGVEMKPSIVETHPDLVAQWHPKKNGDLKPGDFTHGSDKKIWWKCPVVGDHEWEARISARTIMKCGCPCCQGLKAVKSNCLSTTHPEIAVQWHPTKNGDKKPENYVVNSHKRIWWQCLVSAEHEWQATIKSIMEGNGCPCCSGRKSTKSNCFLKSHPEIAAQWHPTKNSDLKPENFTPGSGKKIWWQCSIVPSHEWLATLNNRRHGRDCPHCKKSKGEKAIECFLKSNRIKFKREKTFKTCKKLAPLRFDFFVEYKNNTKLIEYQGEQHYRPVFGGKKHSKYKVFSDTQERDKIKKDWCDKNKIPLLTIPYWDFDRIPKMLENFLEINT